MSKMLEQKKAQQVFSIATFASIAMLLVTGIVTTSISAGIIEDVDNTFEDATVAANITQFGGGSSLQSFADFYSLIGLVVVAALVLGVVRQFL